MKQATDWKVVPFDTELGWMVLEYSDGKVKRLRFGYSSRSEALKAVGAKPSACSEPDKRTQGWIDLLKRYAAGEEVRLDKIPIVDQSPSQFVKDVCKACRNIPFGAVLTYGDVAMIVGSPGAARAVGNVMRKNETPLIIPCHRVVGTTGLGGYSSPQGLKMKERLLIMEMGDAACECCEGVHEAVTS